MTHPPSFSQLFTIALTKSLNTDSQHYYLTEIAEVLGDRKLIEVKKGKLPKYSKKTYHVLTAIDEIFSQWMHYLDLVTHSKGDSRTVNREWINFLIKEGVSFNNIKKLPNYNIFINFFSFHYALNQFSHDRNSFNNGEYIELEQGLNKALYGEVGDATLNEYINELQARFDFNLNHYNRFSYIPELVKNNLSPLNKVKVSMEVRRLVELLEEPKTTILEELDYDFQLTRQDAPYHLNSVKLNNNPISDEPIHVSVPTVETLEDRILSRLKSLTPTQFEHLSLHIIAHMEKEKYDDIKDMITHSGKVADGGIDGIIKTKNKRGKVKEVYIQCKRYANTSISSTELQSFAGAMDSYNPIYGIFITTSTFSKPAIDYIETTRTKKIDLIDGHELVDYIIEHKIGIKELPQTPIYEIDEDYFNNFPKK
ncbi:MULTISPECIES: restriction endonuclease [unclassified Acinetobacter]|uniref:restriction endonuclease n=1 Tax=unclassified Acinetobacter TaxID=196816 RepID=UPI00244D2C98|nr:MULTISPECIES: restriction endonuclease [unclassified Acinetobacter]MDH0032562.1 restriction endonuclease [Acinetobacter sp. GD04021]MDH0885253.1 restriction endonuclease [Acinetobacter sp. GD03873]MDH1084419.1 restriction endonuclease [Acinetobacter sp. GD03983]MDH2188307.1 restriction endonuclease [Acinetobacter sp. GD03645]MDH2203818.1 restriction endonuclease [Acinetobacter sp. GD03647]